MNFSAQLNTTGQATASCMAVMVRSQSHKVGPGNQGSGVRDMSAEFWKSKAVHAKQTSSSLRGFASWREAARFFAIPRCHIRRHFSVGAGREPPLRWYCGSRYLDHQVKKLSPPIWPWICHAIGKSAAMSCDWNASFARAWTCGLPAPCNPFRGVTMVCVKSRYGFVRREVSLRPTTR
jgi:hypothetical protein